MLSGGAVRCGHFAPLWCRCEWLLMSYKCKEGPNQYLTSTPQEDKGNLWGVCILTVHEELLRNRLGKQRGLEVTMVAWWVKVSLNRFIRPPAAEAGLVLSLQLHSSSGLQHLGCGCSRNTMHHCPLVRCVCGCFPAAPALQFPVPMRKACLCSGVLFV